MTNNVQTLDTNKKRGRPKRRINEYLEKSYPALRSRQSINNRSHALTVGMIALGAGLVDAAFRDIKTGKTAMTKLAEIGRLYPYQDGFLDSADGKQWLTDNWDSIIAMPTAEFIKWCKSVKRKEETP